MIFEWFVMAAATVLGWVFSVFPQTTVVFPAPLSIVVPVPGGLAGAGIGSWFVTMAAAFAGLAGGKLLQWIYSNIPFVG